MKGETAAFRSEKKRLLLVIANSRWLGKRHWNLFPYSALILTRLLKEDFDFEILDANGENLTTGEAAERMRSWGPDAVLVATQSVEYGVQYHEVARLAKEVRPDCTTVFGGVYATVLPEEAVKDPNVDFVFLWHAEERVGDFLEAVFSGAADRLRTFPGLAFRDASGAEVLNPVESYISDVRVQVKPDYSRIDVRPYLVQESDDYQSNAPDLCGNILTSYGCQYNCLFCAARTISGRKVAFRPVADVLEEMEYLMNEHGVRYFIFHDDAFVANRKRTRQMLNAFIERQYNVRWKLVNVAAWNLDDELLSLLKAAGCEQLTISVESGSQRVLKEIVRKPLKLEIVPPLVRKCRALGITIGANFVFGFPGETWEEIRQTVRFAEQCDFDIAHFCIATPLPKTDLYELAREKGCLPADFSFTDPRFFGFGRAFLTTDEFTPFELMVLRSYEWDRINFGTPEKLRKIAELMNLSVAELNEHRRLTRQRCGVHFIA
ncbi:MAG: radical SAM protein [Deltaproteobacteria bacterium]|nr:radical SAM protein [Deltaproteobacteria bacterium]